MTHIIYNSHTRLQIVPYTFSKTSRHRWYQAGTKYWFPGFGFDSGPNVQPCHISTNRCIWVDLLCVLHTTSAPSICCFHLFYIDQIQPVQNPPVDNRGFVNLILHFTHQLIHHPKWTWDNLSHFRKTSPSCLATRYPTVVTPILNQKNTPGLIWRESWGNSPGLSNQVG